MPANAPTNYAIMIRSIKTEFAAFNVKLKKTPMVTIGLKCPPEIGAKMLNTT